MAEFPDSYVGLTWHCHHEILFDWCHNYGERRRYIEENKPKDERAMRLKLFQPVRGTLGDPKLYAALGKADAAWNKADAACVKADAAWDKAYAAWTKGDAAWDKAYGAWVKEYAALGKADAARGKAKAAWMASIKPGEAEKLHAIECPNCPWD